MKFKRIITLSFLSALSVGLFAGAIINAQKIKSPEIATAWSLDVTPSVTADYYSTCDGKTGTTLKSSSADFNKPKNKSYNWERYEAADEAYDDSTSILCIYTRHNIKKNMHCGSYSWDRWNREHVYTQSAFPNSDDDNHNIFACEGQINNYRGNLKFAEVKNSGGKQLTVFGHLTNCYKTSDYFEPCDEAKGEIARACLYCTVYYGYTLPQIFDSIDTALKWNATYQVTPREIYRNNKVHGLQGNRNPFVDHPSYAQAIYGGPEYTWEDPIDGGGFDPVDVTGVSLDKTTANLLEGESTALVATVMPSNATNKNVTWSSSNSSVATVTNGTVKALKEGTATITVTTADGGFTDDCLITVEKAPVISVTGVSLNKNTIDLEIGKYQQLYAAVSPSNATDKSVTWSTSDANIATITNGNIKGIKEGTATITVTTTDGGFTDTCEVKVIKPEVVIHVESISLNYENVILRLGETLQLEVTFNPSNATNKEIRWSLLTDSPDDPMPISFSEDGLVTAIEYGYVQITATSVDGNKVAVCIIGVEKESKPTPQKNGCGGNIVSSSVIISTLSILGISSLLIKRNKRFNKQKQKKENCLLWQLKKQNLHQKNHW